MSLKSIFLLLFFCLFGVAVFSQKVRMGFFGGANVALANYNFPAARQVDNAYLSEWKTNNQIGLFIAYDIEYDISDRIFTSTGLVFTRYQFDATNRHVFSNNAGTNEYHNQFNLAELQVPLMVHYRAGKFSGGFGPFVALALGGTLKFSYSINGDPGSSSRQTLVFNNSSSEYADFRPMNAGLGAEVGYGIKRWRLVAHVDLGLVNVSPKLPSNDSPVQAFPLKRSALGVSFLYQPWPR